ncbi:MAG TPA: cell envelope integrity protein TolA [Burkholderiales bacterium]|nr:cell envelope integrity protein TolA [Burkholderiales bacterium]
MSAYRYPTPSEKIISSAFTLGVHLLFAMFLVFGLTWQRQYRPEVNSVDLWASLPSSPPPVPLPVVKPEPVAPPEPAAPAPPPIAKPDIALKDKTANEAHASDEKRREEEKRQQELEAQQRIAQEQAQAKQNLAAQQSAARQAEIDRYKHAISERIKRFIVVPPDMQGNPEAEFTVRVLPGGEVLSAPLKKSSGVPAYDNAVERAILKAQPLPLPPPDSPIFNEFRELTLAFRPQQ